MSPNNTSTNSTSEKNSGDSMVQDGKGIEKQELKHSDVSKQPEEFIEKANNNTKLANQNPSSSEK